MKKHGDRESHVRRSKQIIGNSKLDNFIDNKKSVRDVEVQICAWAAEHNKSPQDVEDFVALAKAVFTDSMLVKDLALKRTKTTAIITNVLGETHHQELVSMMRSQPFSLIID